MKPSWDQAPEWANYLAMDQCGDWYWYENKPEKCDSWWGCVSGMFAVAYTNSDFRNTLESKP